MASDEPRDVSADYEDSPSNEESYVLCLYIAGHTPRSARAISNIKKICEDELAGRYDLEIIDIYQEPERARGEQLFALPTLIKRLPVPLRKVIGDLSDRDKVLVGLNLRPRKRSEHGDG